MVPVDTSTKVITPLRMTVPMQIRVESRVAEKFKRAAKLRGKTPSAYLRQVIEQAAAAPVARTWKNHRKLIESLKLTRVPYNIVVKMREECDER